MTDFELIDSISSDERIEQSEIQEIVYEVCSAAMARYDSVMVAEQITSEWAWSDVLLLLKGQHPGYEIVSESLNEAAHRIRDYWGNNSDR